MAECLQNSGIEYSKLKSGVPYSLNALDQETQRHSWIDPTNVNSVVLSMSRSSAGDITSFNDNDSIGSSPEVKRRILINEYSFDAMKRALAEPTELLKRERNEKQLQINKTFRNAKFDDLIRLTEPKHDVIQTRLSDLFNSLTAERQIISQSDSNYLNAAHQNKTIYENNFPELFFF